jgi:transposase
VNQIIRIGMDTSKHIFQLYGVDGAEQPVLRKRLRRKEVLAFFAKLPPTVIGMEACGASHYWARELQQPHGEADRATTREALHQTQQE